MESIKIGTQSYELVADGYQLQQDGGCIIFQPGEQTFEEVETVMSGVKSILLLDENGDTMAYAGRMTRQKDYVIRVEKNQTGTDSEGNAVYEYKDITGTVLIAEFRLPDLREKYAALEEEVTNTQLAIVELYEGGEA